MNMRQSVTEEVEQSANNDGEQEELDQIEVDFSSIPFVKFYPTTAITGTLVEGEGNPIIRFPDASNNGGRRDQGYLGLVMEDLSIKTTGADDTGFDMTEATFVETDADDTTEYRAVNFGDSQTTEKYGGEAVNIAGDQYGVVSTTDSIDGRAILVVDRTASQSVARKLDVNGDTFAGMDEETGQVNGGLIEYAPDGADVEWNSRYTRNPELRDEFYGEELTTLVTRRSLVDEDYSERVNNPEDQTRDMMWYSLFTEDGAVTATTGEPVGYSYLEERFDPSAGNLPESDIEFVREYIEQGAPTDESTIVSNIEENTSRLSEEPDVERIVGLIQADIEV